MKRFCICIILCALLGGCALSQEEPSSVAVLSGEGEDTLLESLRIDEYLVAVDPSLVVYSDNIVHGPSFVPREEIGRNHTVQSRSVTGCASYLDRWYRDYEAYFPLFSKEEIPYGGLDAVNAYYKEESERALEHMESYFREEFSQAEIIDSPMNWAHYQYRNDTVSFAGPFLSVRRLHSMYTGGAHDSYGESADNFDMRTGRMLPLADVLRTGEEADALFSSLIERYASTQDDFAGFGMTLTASQPFSLGGKGTHLSL